MSTYRQTPTFRVDANLLSPSNEDADGKLWYLPICIHGATNQKGNVVISTAVKNSNLTFSLCLLTNVYTNLNKLNWKAVQCKGKIVMLYDGKTKSTVF